MVKVTFKNVGQGDSIILEWKSSDGTKKLGIIDCNLFQGTNPVLQDVIDKSVQEVEFMILSHLHYDHFSGFYGLINYCRNENIRIKRFLHTSTSTPSFLKSASRSVEASDKLFDLFNLLMEMRDKGEIALNTIEDNPDLVMSLNDEFKMQVLSPSSKDTENYIQGVKFPFDEEVSWANPNANWLSTVLKIYNDELCMLLTGDAEKSVFSRIGKRKGGRLEGHKMGVAQIPHHGAKGNLNKIFWQKLKRFAKTYNIISVGENKYKHPSLDVLNFFEKTPNYIVYCTNDKGEGLSEKSKLNSLVLDIVSSDLTQVKNNRNIFGDLTFNLSGNTYKVL